MNPVTTSHRLLTTLLCQLLPLAFAFGDVSGTNSQNTTYTGTNNFVGQAFINSQTLNPSNKIVTVSTETSRHALTSGSVNNLDWVKVTTPDEGGYRNLYGVLDAAHLSTELSWAHLGTFLLVPQDTVAPVLSSTYSAPGQRLGSSHGTWTDFPISYTYQWQTSPTGVSGWTNITSGTTNGYAPVDGNVGNYLRCLVAASNGAGTGSQIATNSTRVSVFPPFPSGCIGRWSLGDDGTGSVDLADLSGHSHALTNVGPVPLATIGEVESASFDPETPAYYLALPAGLCDVGNDAMSYNIWVYFPTDPTGYQFIWMQGTGVDISDLNPIYVETNLEFAEIDQAPLWVPFYSTVTATSGAWHMITCVLDGSGTKTLYIDGGSASGGTTVTASYSPPISASGSQFQLGGYTSLSGYTNSTPENLSHAALFNRALTSDEVTNLWNGGIPW